VQFLHRIRLFCNVSRKAVERATGVSEFHLARYENGHRPLNDFEEAAVRSFLCARLKMAAEEEGGTPTYNKELHPWADLARETTGAGFKR
jgi:hypothetical protein